MGAGACINCPEGPRQCKLILGDRSIYFFGPPPLWERLKTSVFIRIEDAAFFKKAAFNYFMAHAEKVGRDILEKESRIVRSLKYSLGNFLIYAPLKNMLGFLM